MYYLVVDSFNFPRKIAEKIDWKNSWKRISFALIVCLTNLISRISLDREIFTYFSSMTFEVLTLNLLSDSEFRRRKTMDLKYSWWVTKCSWTCNCSSPHGSNYRLTGLRHLIDRSPDLSYSLVFAGNHLVCFQSEKMVDFLN